MAAKKSTAKKSAPADPATAGNLAVILGVIFAALVVVFLMLVRNQYSTI